MRKIETRTKAQKVLSLCVAGTLATSMVGVAAVQALGEGAGTALAAVQEKLANSLVYDAVYGVSDQGLAVMEKHGDFTTESGKTVREVASFDVVDSKGNVIMSFGEKDLGSNGSHAYGFRITNFAKMQEQFVGNSSGLVVLMGHDEEGDMAYAVMSADTGKRTELVYESVQALYGSAAAAAGMREDGRYVDVFDKNGNVIKTLEAGDHIHYLEAVHKAGSPSKLYAPRYSQGALVTYEWSQGQSGFVEADVTANFKSGYSYNAPVNWAQPVRKLANGSAITYKKGSNGKWGAVNAAGQTVIPFEYDAYGDCGGSGSLVLLKKNGSWQFFDVSALKMPAASSSKPAAKPAAKPAWVKSGGKWWYRHADGGCTKNGWEKIGGSWYHFDKAGWMQSGWQKVSKKWYWLGSDGAMKTGWQKIGGSWYYLGSDGAMRTGWYKVGKSWYYSNASGTMQAKKWVGNYYLTGSGAMATNQWIGKYHVNASGLWDKTRR